MLNAFRHHGLYRDRLPHTARSEPDQVLNAFRHHGLYRQEPAEDSLVTDEKCSTPFGITDYIGSDQITLCQSIACSTPFGITDYIGRSSAARRPTGPPGAQRLSASRIISAVVEGLDFLLPGAQRLSASRIISGAGYHRTAAWSGAQRLSASRIISATGSSSPTTTRDRAQRLSASRIISVHLVNCFLQTDKWSQKHGSLGLL